MNSMNHVFLMGNLTRDPESRQLASGATVTDLGLAVSDNYKDREGQLVERTVFADIVTRGRQAETCAEYLKKGVPVMVEGKLQLDQWKTDSGEKRSKMRIRANRVQFIGRSAKENDNGHAAAAAAAPLNDEESVPF